MINGSIRIATVWGVPLRVHTSWLLVLFLVVIILASEFRELAPWWSKTEQWGLALLTSLLFFASVVTHELAHSLLALRKGIPVRSITLFVFGGVSQISREASRPGIEFQVAIIGPISSLALGGIFKALEVGLGGQSEHARNALLILSETNLALGVFNLLPGFPLDGGRVLRAVLWGITRNYIRATRIATWSGLIMAGVLILGGIAFALAFRSFSGLWLALIGWFLYTAAAGTGRQLRLQQVLQPFQAKDILTPDFNLAPADKHVQEAVEHYVLPLGRRPVLLSDGVHITGLVDLRAIRKIPRGQWGYVPVSSVSIPLTQLSVVPPHENALRAVELLEAAPGAMVLVMEESKLLGIISQESVSSFHRTRTELGL
ncbi:MAG: site-2 protease family protein [Chloroflexi bacterium]|nr:site-2 protease family protein [Chloroflexota bacterium]